MKIDVRTVVKSSRNKKDLNDVTDAPFLVFFSQLPAPKSIENGVAVTSLRSFLFRDNFSNLSGHLPQIQAVVEVVEIQNPDLFNWIFTPSTLACVCGKW